MSTLPSGNGNASARSSIRSIRIRNSANRLRAMPSISAIKAVLESLRDTDVRPLLPRIVTPTLVLHRRGDRAVRIEAGRDLAGAIRGARLVELDGDDHWLWAGNQRCVLEEIRAFVRRLEEGRRPAD